MFGLWRPHLVSALLLLLVAKGTLEQTLEDGGRAGMSRFSDFFSSVNLLVLEDDIVLTNKLLATLEDLEALGQSTETPVDHDENMAVVEEVFLSAHDFQADKTPSQEKVKTTMPSLSISSIGARRDTLKKFLLHHPFQFLGLLFSDLEEQDNASTGPGEEASTDLLSYLGLKLMFKYVLKIFGTKSKIGNFIVSVSDSMRAIDGESNPESAHRNTFEWIGVENPSVSLVTTKENEFGLVSDVENEVTTRIIFLMAAVTEDGHHLSPKEKLSFVLLQMKTLVTVVKEFILTLKYEVFPAELAYLNHLKGSSRDSIPQTAKPAKLSTAPLKTAQYPEFYEQFLLGNAPPVAGKAFGEHKLEEKLHPAPAVYKSFVKRAVANSSFTEDGPQHVDNSSLADDGPKHVDKKRSGLGLLEELFRFPRNDPRLVNPLEKWNILRKLFKVDVTKSRKNYYNYFVDESSLADRIKSFTTLLETREKNSSLPKDNEALVTTKHAITNLEKLLTDVYGVRKVAINQDPEGVQDFGEVYYNAENLLDAIVEVSQTNNFSAVSETPLDLSSGKILQQVFKETLD